MKARIAKLESKLKHDVDEQDKKRHAQNIVTHDTLLKYGERIREVEIAAASNATELALHTANILTLEKNDARIEKVVENNTLALNMQAVAFADLSSAVRTSAKLAIVVVPILSSLVAYIAHYIIGQ